MPLSLTKKICDLLISKNLVTQENLDRARKVCTEKGGSLSDILVEMKAVTREDLLTTLSEGLGFPPIKLSRVKIDPEVLALIPKKTLLSYKMLPLSRTGKHLTVAMVDPLNIFALDDLKVLTNMNISPVIASEDDMNEAFRKYFERSAHEEISSIVDGMGGEDMKMISGGEAEAMSAAELARITDDAPVVKLANMVLVGAVKDRASDVMIEPMESATRVRYRVDGKLIEKYFPPKKFHEAIISRLKIMSDLNIAERRLPQDGRFRMKVDGRKIDFRVSIVPSSFGEKAALRILDKEQAMINLETLGFSERDKATIRKASERPHGMILVCGPTGCGKTTTLYSILANVDDPTKNLVTVEDPVEYELKGINQVAINEAVGLTFAGCLRSILRQDPDIIMVGEIRDFDTLDVAIKSALTGHLVLSTLHTNSAAGSVTRMMNMGVEPFLIAASVELIVAQRLLRRLCTSCRVAYRPEKEIAETYNLFDEKGNIAEIYKPSGCKHCLSNGYKGRIGIAECMNITKAVKELIFKRAQDFELEKAAREEGMVTLRENGIENVLSGATSLEEVLRSTVASSGERQVK